jgi:hypothetical protein
VRYLFKFVAGRSAPSWLEALETNNIAECEAISMRYGLSKNSMAETYMYALEVNRDVFRSTGVEKGWRLDIPSGLAPAPR